MKAYEVFLVQTQSAINYLYIIVICILPVLWLGDCRKTMSLLFKRIRLPELYDALDQQIEISNGLQILIIVTAVFAYFLHRRWRYYILDLRCRVLKLEIEYTDNEKTNEMKIKLLQNINNIIERKSDYSKSIHDTERENVDEIQPEASTIENQPRDDDSNKSEQKRKTRL